MKIVMPIAGRGSRFVAQGFVGPKPLLEIAGKPMVKWAVESVQKVSPGITAKDFIFICLQEHEDQHQITARLKEILGDEITVRFTPGVTEGAACTALLVKDLINNDEDILVGDCDQFFRVPDFEALRQEARANDWGGLIPTDEQSNPGYSYAEVGPDGFVTRTAEKEQISTHAAIGIYYFQKGKYFVEAAEEMIEKNVRFKNEFYMCPVYNFVMANGHKVKIVPAAFWMTVGTPEEAKRFTEFAAANPDKVN